MARVRHRKAGVSRQASLSANRAGSRSQLIHDRNPSSSGCLRSKVNVHFLKEVALAVAQKQHLETVMKAIKNQPCRGFGSPAHSSTSLLMIAAEHTAITGER